jgi:hypothetical protein
VNYPVKEILRNIFSVVAGVLSALATIIPCVILSWEFSYKDGNIQEDFNILTFLISSIGIIGGAILGGYITAKISTRKDIIHILLTGIILSVLYLASGDFKINYLRTKEILILLLPIPIVSLGGFIGIKQKQKSIQII